MTTHSLALPTRFRLRASITMLAITALLVGPVLPSLGRLGAPAQAASAAAFSSVPMASAVSKKAKAPAVAVVPGDKQLTVKWSKVKGAKKYILQYADNKKFKKSRTVITSVSSRTKVIKRLRVRTNYWVRVRAVSPVASTYSKATLARPTSAPTGRIAVKVTPAGANKVKVSWKRLKQGTKITLVASYHHHALSKKATRFSVTGINATETSRILTVPKKFRNQIGTGTANPVYVQAWTYNGTRKNTSRAAYATASPSSVTGTSNQRLTFASYNVGSISSTLAKPSRSWANRRASAARAIKNTGAAVVAVQEATTAKHDGVPHYLDLEGLLSGYKLAYHPDKVGTAGKANSTKGAHIYYQPSKVSVLASGVESIRPIVPSSIVVAKDRHFAWAQMKDRTTGAQFYVVSVHLQTGSTVTLQRLRLAAIKGIDTFIAKKPRAGVVPIIIMGDLNTDVARYPNGASTYLTANGYYDAAAALSTSGMQYSTSNNHGDPVAAGYPLRPYKYAYAPSRIDYIFVKNGNGSVRYRNQVILKNGNFDDAYRGSDHNLQSAVIPILN